MKRTLLIAAGCALLAVCVASIYQDAALPAKRCPVCDEPLEFRYAAEYGDTKAETFRCDTCQSEYRCLILSDGRREWRLVGPETINNRSDTSR